jgi:hypothetical protein
MSQEFCHPLVLRRKGKSEALRLSDVHGCWCAWCLQYFRMANELELHHMIARAHARELFGERSFIDSWSVPVHRGLCHRSIQRFSDSATLRLAEDASKPYADLMARSRAAFYAGELSRGLFLREVAHGRITSTDRFDPLDERENLIHLFNCAAGSVLVTKLLNSRSTVAREWRQRLQNDPLVNRVRGLVRLSPFWQFYAADVYANAGAYQTAKLIIAEAESALPRVFKSRHSASGALARRKSLLLADYKSSNDAAVTAHADNDWYNLRTALLGRGWALFVKGDPNGALDDFYSVGTNPQALQISLWHRFCAEFGIGCIYLSIEGREGLDFALSALLRSQYLSALFGLQGNPVPDPRLPDAPAPSFVTPTEMLHWIGKKFGTETSPERLSELRSWCLLPIRDGLLSEIAHGA